MTFASLPWLIGSAFLLVGGAWSWFNIFNKGVLATEDYELSTELSEADEGRVPWLTGLSGAALSARMRAARNIRISVGLALLGAAVLTGKFYTIIF